MITEINEGQTNLVTAGVTLQYPGINSCLSITSVDHQNGTRAGGHAVLIAEEDQKSLQDICAYVATNPGDFLFIIGDIGCWNGNWGELPQTQNLMVNGQQVESVSGIAAALNYVAGKFEIFDIRDWHSEDTFDIFFNAQSDGSLFGKTTSGGAQFTIAGYERW